MGFKINKTLNRESGIFVAVFILILAFSGCAKKETIDGNSLLDENQIEIRLVELAKDTLKTGSPPAQADLDPIINSMAALDDSINESIIENVGMKAEKEAGAENMLANFEKLFWIFELAMQVQAKKVELMDSESQGAIQPVIESIVDVSKKVVSDKNYSISEATVDDIKSKITQLDISQFDPYYDLEEDVEIAMGMALSPDAVDENDEQEMIRISTELEKLQIVFDEFEVRLARQRQDDEMQDDLDSMARFDSILENPESNEIERELAAWGKNLMEDQNEAEAIRTILSRLDACLLRDDLEGYKNILSEYSDIHDLIGQPSDKDGMMGPLGHVFQISPLNKAILAGKVEFCEAVLPLYPDINFGKPLARAISAINRYIYDEFQVFETRDDLGGWETIPELDMKSQNLVSELKKNGTPFDLIEWLLDVGADPDINSALHAAVLSWNIDTPRVIEIMLDNGANPNKLYNPDGFKHMVWSTSVRMNRVDYPISPLDCTLLINDSDQSESVSITRKLLKEYGGKYDDVILSLSGPDLDSLKLLVENKGGNFLYKNVPAIEIAVIFKNLTALNYLKENGADLKYINPKTGWNLYETFTWANRGVDEWRKTDNVLMDSYNGDLEKILKDEGLEIEHLYPAVATNDPDVFERIKFPKNGLNKRVEFSPEYFGNIYRLKNRSVNKIMTESTAFGFSPYASYNVMELIINLNSYKLFDSLKTSAGEYRVSAELFNVEYPFYFVYPDNFVSKWRELAESGIRLEYTSADENKYLNTQYALVDRKIRDLFQKLKGRKVNF